MKIIKIWMIYAVIFSTFLMAIVLPSWRMTFPNNRMVICQQEPRVCQLPSEFRIWP